MKVTKIAILAASITRHYRASGRSAGRLDCRMARKHPCEKLCEDAQVRVARCTFPPARS